MRQIVLNGVGATTSAVMNTNYLENITGQFTATGISSGNGVLTFLGSNDGINYVAFAVVDPTPATTNAQNLIRSTSLTLNSNASKVFAIENTAKFEFIKFTLTWTTDGAYTVIIHSDKKSS
jgi:hypothetical protein